MASRYLPALLLLPLLAACSSEPSSHTASCPEGAVCTEPPRGPAHALRADGTVDITVEEAWPHRAVEDAPLTAQEHVMATAIIERCTELSAQDRVTLLDSLSASAGWFWEERAVPQPGQSERWPFLARRVLQTPDDCAAVAAATQPRTGQINCEEDGCWWQSMTDVVPTVTCNGTVATLVSGNQTTLRDCARAFTVCDETSSTGCSDRAPIACDLHAVDRCDGDVHLGCDGTGKVSFHDCARIGGTCQLQGTSAVCIPPDAGKCAFAGHQCGDGVVNVCMYGELVSVPLATLGLATCTP